MKSVLVLVAEVRMADVARTGEEAVDLSIIGFGGASNLPVWYAQECGLFAREGLRVRLDATPGSVAQMRAIMEDRYALATTAFDNIVAYAEGQGEFAAPGFDLVAFLGVHSGLNSLIARPEIGTVEDLRGRTVAVDALGTGYAFLLFGLLEGRGLLPGRDYSVLSVGSGERRLEALESGKAQAALMSAPSDLRALASGCRMLGDATQVFGRYQGSVYAARRVFARNHADELARFARAIKGAHAAVYADPAGSLDILRARLQGVSDNDAARIYARLTSSAGGLAPEAETDVEGVRNVLALRARWSGRDWAPGDPAKYVERVA